MASESYNVVSLLDFVESSMIKYGLYTMENRAIVDIHDGLKPVHRRILYAMSMMGLHHNRGYKKSAHVVGAVIGKYHPHGDSAVYKAMTGLASEASMALIDGQGNWGSMDNPPAAMRYTECRLSEYADKYLLDPKYMAVLPMVPNYDGTDKEPIILPSKEPNILYNSNVGIAVGVATNTPPFKRKGVMKLVKRLLKGKKVTAQHCVDTLEFNYAYGGTILSSDEDLLEYFKEGRGRITFGVEANFDKARRTFTIIGLTPDFKWSAVSKMLAENDDVRSADDLSDKDGYKYVIKFKPSVKDLKEAGKKLRKKLQQSITYATYVTVRKNDTAPADDEKAVSVKATTIPEILTEWTEWRVDLEVKYLTHLKGQLKVEIAYNELLILAAREREALFKILKQKQASYDELTKAVAKALGVTTEQAEQVLALQVRRLSRISENELKEKIEGLEKELDRVRKGLKDPSAYLLQQMEE